MVHDGNVGGDSEITRRWSQPQNPPIRCATLQPASNEYTTRLTTPYSIHYAILQTTPCSPTSTIDQPWCKHMVGPLPTLGYTLLHSATSTYLRKVPQRQQRLHQTGQPPPQPLPYSTAYLYFFTRTLENSADTSPMPACI